MAPGVDANRLKREIQAAERKAQAEWKRSVANAEREMNREVARVNRENLGRGGGARLLRPEPSSDRVRRS